MYVPGYYEGFHHQIETRVKTTNPVAQLIDFKTPNKIKLNSMVYSLHQKHLSHDLPCGGREKKKELTMRKLLILMGILMCLMPQVVSAGGEVATTVNKPPHFVPQPSSGIKVSFVSEDDTSVVLCSEELGVTIDLGAGSDILATCYEDVEAIRITHGKVFLDTSADQNVMGTHYDDIIVLCPNTDGLTVNGLRGNDTIVTCDSPDQMFVF